MWHFWFASDVTCLFFIRWKLNDFWVSMQLHYLWNLINLLHLSIYVLHYSNIFINQPLMLPHWKVDSCFMSNQRKIYCIHRFPIDLELNVFPQCFRVSWRLEYVFCGVDLTLSGVKFGCNLKCNLVFLLIAKFFGARR